MLVDATWDDTCSMLMKGTEYEKFIDSEGLLDGKTQTWKLEIKINGGHK